MAGVAYAHVETKLFTLREATVPVLPPGSRDLRVLHVSDLHLVPTQRRKIEWVRSLAELEPDLVVDTGDNLAHVDALEPLLDALAPLLAVPGAFVLGSNDYFAPVPKNPARYLLPDARLPFASQARLLPAAEMAGAMRDAGWVDLTNRRDVLDVGGVRLDLVGVDDPHLDRDVFPAPESQARPLRRRAACSGSGSRTRRTGGSWTRCTTTARSSSSRATHGGQLCVPGFGALVTNCDIDRKRAKGLHGWPGPAPTPRAARTRRGCTSPPAQARPRSRRSGSRAAPRRRSSP